MAEIAKKFKDAGATILEMLRNKTTYKEFQINLNIGEN